MKKTIDGVTYKQHKENKGCDGCVADYGDALCRTLNDDGGCFVSWKMVKAKGPLQVGSTLKLDGVRYVAHAEEVGGCCDGCAGDGKGPCRILIDKAGKKFSNTEDGTCGEHNLIWKPEVASPAEREVVSLAERERVEAAPLDLTDHDDCSSVAVAVGATFKVKLRGRALDGEVVTLKVVHGGECSRCAVNDSGYCVQVPMCHQRHFEALDGEPTLAKRLEQNTGGWIEWAGGGRPVSGDTRVEVEIREGDREENAAHYFWWDHVLDVPGADIVRYRVVKQPEAPTTQTVMVSFTFPADLDRGTVEGYAQNIVRTAVNGTPRDKDAHALLMNWDVE